MKTILYTLIISLISNSLFAQEMHLEFVKSSSDHAAARTRSMKLDADANMYIVGIFGFYNDTLNFDENDSNSAVINKGGLDIFIEKQDADGNFIWGKSIGGISHEQPTSFDIDLNGNVYITGNFSDSIDLDPGSGTQMRYSAGQTDMFILKLNTNGEFAWAITYGNQYGDDAKGICTDQDGNILLSGTFFGVIDFDIGPNDHSIQHRSGTQMFVLKLDSNGNFIWVESFESLFTGPMYSQDITTNSNGDIFITGDFWETSDINPGPGTTKITAIGAMDVFVLKMNAEGEFIWGKSMGGPDGDMGRSITVDENDEVYVTGFFKGKPDFDPGPNEFILYGKKETDIFLQKLDKDGNFLWAKSIGSDEYDYGHRVVTDKIGGVYITGSFQFAPDFNTGSGVEYINSKGYEDFYIVKHSSNGQYLWTQTFGGPYSEHAEGIAIYNDTNIYLAGYYHQKVDFDPRQSQHVYLEAYTPAIFTAKYSLCTPSISYDTLTSCGNYTWIDGRTYRSNIEHAYHTIIGGAANGCDSIVILNLTIVANSALTITDTSITSNAVDATYQWLDCANNFAILPDDTNQTIELTHSATYAVEVTKAGCVDTSDCIFVGAVGVIEPTSYSSFNIYPNPSTGNVTIEFEKPQFTTVTIYSITGKEVYKKEIINETIVSLNLDISPGVYIIKASNNATAVIQKIIIQ